MKAIVQQPGESRIDYMMRVMEAYFQEHPVNDYTLIWDEAECDGHCLVDDMRTAVDELGIDDD